MGEGREWTCPLEIALTFPIRLSIPPPLRIRSGGKTKSNQYWNNTNEWSRRELRKRGGLNWSEQGKKCGIRAHRHHGGRGVRKIGDYDDDDVSVHVIQPARNERAPGAADTESPVRRHYTVFHPRLLHFSDAHPAVAPHRRPCDVHKKRGDTIARKGGGVGEATRGESLILSLSLHPKEANRTEQVSDIRDLAPFWCGFVVRPRSLLRSPFPFI